MVLKIARFLNLLLVGVLTGNEFGGFIGFHRTVEQALARLREDL
jgi:hypothetical protein